MAKATIYYRHADGDQWFWLKRVTKAQTVDTPWGEATAEVGTFIMTLKGDRSHQIICTQDDLENYWTTDPVPEPIQPPPWAPPKIIIDPSPSDLPGSEHRHGS